MSIMDEIKQLVEDQIRLRKDYRKMPVSGERVEIHNNNGEDIEVIVYQPDCEMKNLPVLIEVHGGAWIAGDAVLVNSLCRKIADETPAVVINLNYKKIDQYPFPYQQNELMNTVLWVKKNANLLNADPEKIYLCGQSAGGHICATGAILLKQKGVSVYRQILVYPTTDYASLEELPEESGLNTLPQLQHEAFFPEYPIETPLISPMHASVDFVRGVAPATIIVCGQDVLKEMGMKYEKWLKAADVCVELLEYPDAKHGFLETNRIEYKDWPDNSPQQNRLARSCEQVIINLLKN